MAKIYVKNKDLLAEFKASKEKGSLNPEIVGMFYLIIDGISKKMSI